jgi:hypothetical protein
MKNIWNEFLTKLLLPGIIHRIYSPCSSKDIQQVEKKFGKIPNDLLKMLNVFNGAILFIGSGGEFITFFKTSIKSSSPDPEWAPDWYIDKFTHEWRATKEAKATDWAIAMTNYGGLVIMHEDGSISEWDTAINGWTFNNMVLNQWMDVVIKEGNKMLNES